MEFMSPEHVATMNALLRDAPTVRAECARLSRPRVISYRLTDGPGGETAHWTIAVTDTVQFALDEAPTPDVRLVGDWAQMIRASSANREGRQVHVEISVEGDESVLAEVDTAIETARAIATVPVEFPSV